MWISWPRNRYSEIVDSRMDAIGKFKLTLYIWICHIQTFINFNIFAIFEITIDNICLTHTRYKIWNKTSNEEEHLTLWSSSSCFTTSLSGDESGELASSSASRNAIKSSLLDECTGESVTTLICIVTMQQNQIKNQNP